MKNEIYIIITPTICNVGGSQIYSLNKIHYLRKKGFKTYIVHSNIGNNIIIEELAQFAYCGYDKFKFPAQFFTQKERNKLIHKLICTLQIMQTDNIIIESHTITCATWGELIASKLNAKHLVYLLSEYPKIENKGYFNFFNFKYSRKELAGISSNSLNFLFKNWLSIEVNKCWTLPAYCSNVLDDIHMKFSIPFEKYDYIIGSIGRIDKPFILDALDDIILFSKSIQEKHLLLILIGGGSNRSKTQIINKLKRQNNITLYITGNIYPIPIKLIKKIDVFLSTSGSCRVSNSIGKLTISFDVNDKKPIGILNHTTTNTIYRNFNEPKLSLYELLNDILISNKYKENIVPINLQQLNDIDFRSHLEFVKSSENKKEYYDINFISKSFRDIIRIICMRIFTTNLFFKIKTLIKK